MREKERGNMLKKKCGCDETQGWLGGPRRANDGQITLIKPKEKD